MMFVENFRLALFSIRANKMRALLTMLGIIIGIASVIAIMTVGDSLTESLTSSLSELGADNIYVSVDYRKQVGDMDLLTMDDDSYDEWVKTSTPKEEDYITTQMIEDYAEYMGDRIKAISVSRSVGSGQGVDGALYANVSVEGVSLGALLTDNVSLLKGRYFSEKETAAGSNVAIVSDKLVNNLFKGDNDAALGQTVTVEVGDKTYTFTIVGIYEYTESSIMSLLDMGTSDKDISTSLYIPIRTANNITHSETYNYFEIMTASTETEEEFMADTDKYFEKIYERNEKFVAKSQSNTDALSSITSLMDTLTIGISVIAGIALLVGGIGVMNIMLVSITERTREIGTRKALGAPNSSIRLQFIIESVVMCLLGGIIGIALGCAGGMAAAHFMGTVVKPSVRAIIISITFSMAIGIFFGYYPANKAAKMDPIEALRYE